MSGSNFDLPLTKVEQEEGLSLPCLKVNQPIGTFFVAAIDHESLVKITHADVRRIDRESEKKRDFETYLGIQRPLNTSRASKISDYTNTVDACFPSGVILSVKGRCAEYDENTGTLHLRPYASDDEEFEDVPIHKIANVLDGQHRIEGLKRYKQDKPFDINVSIFVDIDVSVEAYLFSTVNLAQTKVTKSLTYDLFGLAKSRSPQKLCHNVAVALDAMEGSPLYGKIKRLGLAEPHNEPVSITQAAFVESLIRYISRDPLKDRDTYMRGKVPARADEKDRDKLVFRDFLIDGRDYELVDIVGSYFSAVRDRWPNAWNSSDKGIMLSRTNGFMALMRFLKDCYLSLIPVSDVPDKAHFDRIFRVIDLKDEDFNTDNYKPGTSGMSELYRDLKKMSGLGK